MKRTSSNDPDDGFAVEISSLDAPETQEPAPAGLLQGPRLAPRVRNWLIILSVVGGMLLVVVVLSPVLFSLWPKKTSTPPKPYLPPAKILNVTVQNGTAYVTSSDGIIRALQVKSGSLLWQHNSAGIAPLFVKNIIYIEYYNQNNIIVQALRAKEGTVVWTFKTTSDANPLIIDDGVAYSLSPFFEMHGHILTALNSGNGAELWQYTMNAALLQNVDIQGMQGKIYITFFPNAQVKNTDLFVLRISDGLLLWHIRAANVQVIQNNLVYTITSDSVLKVLRANDGHEVWQYKAPNVNGWFPAPGTNLLYVQTLEGSLQALRIDTGAIQWTYKNAWGVANIFPEVNGVLYLETGDNFIVALRTSDGARLWHVRPVVAPPFTFGSVEVIDGIVYTFTTAGSAQDETVVALNAIDGSLLWSRKITMDNNNMSPQMSNDQIFADSGSVITVLRARDGAVLWHVNYTQTTSQYNPGLLTFADNMVIVQASDGVLEAHQLGTGALLWRYPRGVSS